MGSNTKEYFFYVSLLSLFVVVSSFVDLALVVKSSECPWRMSQVLVTYSGPGGIMLGLVGSDHWKLAQDNLSCFGEG